jgi:hypothetical protein
MPIPTALDFAKLFHGSMEFEILPKEQVAAKLRELADLVERKEFPRLALHEAHSLQSTEVNYFGATTLVLKFQYLRDPKEIGGIEGEFKRAMAEVEKVRQK